MYTTITTSGSDFVGANYIREEQNRAGLGCDISIRISHDEQYMTHYLTEQQARHLLARLTHALDDLDMDFNPHDAGQTCPECESPSHTDDNCRQHLA